MIISKRRVLLRSTVNPLDTILMIDKGGMDDDIMRQVDGVFITRELIKGKVLETARITARQAVDGLAAPLSAGMVQVIGGKFVLCRKNQKEPKIALLRPTKK